MLSFIFLYTRLDKSVLPWISIPVDANLLQKYHHIIIHKCILDTEMTETELKQNFI